MFAGSAALFAQPARQLTLLPGSAGEGFVLTPTILVSNDGDEVAGSAASRLVALTVPGGELEAIAGRVGRLSRATGAIGDFFFEPGEGSFPADLAAIVDRLRSIDEELAELRGRGIEIRAGSVRILAIGAGSAESFAELLAAIDRALAAQSIDSVSVQPVVLASPAEAQEFATVFSSRERPLDRLPSGTLRATAGRLIVFLTRHAGGALPAEPEAMAEYLASCVSPFLDASLPRELARQLRGGVLDAPAIVAGGTSIIDPRAQAREHMRRAAQVALLRRTVLSDSHDTEIADRPAKASAIDGELVAPRAAAWAGVQAAVSAAADGLRAQFPRKDILGLPVRDRVAYLRSRAEGLASAVPTALEAAASEALSSDLLGAKLQEIWMEALGSCKPGEAFALLSAVDQADADQRRRSMVDVHTGPRRPQEPRFEDLDKPSIEGVRLGVGPLLWAALFGCLAGILAIGLSGTLVMALPGVAVALTLGWVAVQVLRAAWREVRVVAAVRSEFLAYLERVENWICEAWLEAAQDVEIRQFIEQKRSRLERLRAISDNAGLQISETRRSFRRRSAVLRTSRPERWEELTKAWFDASSDADLEQIAREVVLAAGATTSDADGGLAGLLDRAVEAEFLAVGDRIADFAASPASFADILGRPDEVIAKLAVGTEPDALATCALALPRDPALRPLADAARRRRITVIPRLLGGQITFWQLKDAEADSVEQPEPTVLIPEGHRMAAAGGRMWN